MKDDLCKVRNRSILGIAESFNLTNDDLNNRRKSFLDKKTLEMAGIRRVNNDVGHQILNLESRKAYVSYQGVVIPYYNVATAEHIIEYTLRRDFPDREENGAGVVKEKRKYVKPRTTKNFLYVPPMMPRKLLENTDSPIVIFEGEFKALAAARVASEDFTRSDWIFTPVAISGVDNFRTRRRRVLETGEKVELSAGLAEFDFFTWRGRKIIILFDSDIDEKPNVKAARGRLKNFLLEKKAKVFLADLPKEFEGIPTKGFDDFLGAVAKLKSESEALKFGREIIQNALNPKQPKSTSATNYKLILNGETDQIFTEPGVWFSDDENDIFVCSPLEILAETQTETGENYGRLLQWPDSKGRIHRYAMPIGQIHSEQGQILEHLTGRGLRIDVNRKSYLHLRQYINKTPTNRTIISTDRIGWNGKAFVLPDEVFGGDDEMTFQTENTGFDKFAIKGSLTDWKENIGRFAIDNSRLVFAISVAFACPLLPIVEIGGGGFHFRGTTSTGKTTALLVAGSVWGGSDEMSGFCQTWKSTANGLEILAAGHNHALLCLDEIGECEPRIVGDIAYMLANGSGKNRMARNTSRRKSYAWNLLFLSSGERQLSEIMTEAGQRTRGGQEVRLCDIEADTGKHGLFENLHGFSDGREFSDYLRESARGFFGSAIREFLKHIVKLDREKIKTNWRTFQDSFNSKLKSENVVGENESGEIKRVISRFALVAFCGEMATNLRITGWPSGEATKAACNIFRVWREGRGNGQSDAESLIRQVRYFLEKHGQSRFQWLVKDLNEYEKIVNHAGYKKNGKDSKMEFLIFPETFQYEVCEGFDQRFANRVLAERGFLKTGADGKKSRSERIGNSVRRVYVIMSDILEDQSEK